MLRAKKKKCSKPGFEPVVTALEDRVYIIWSHLGLYISVKKHTFVRQLHMRVYLHFMVVDA